MSQCYSNTRTDNGRALDGIRIPNSSRQRGLSFHLGESFVKYYIHMTYMYEEIIKRDLLVDMFLQLMYDKKFLNN